MRENRIVHPADAEYRGFPDFSTWAQCRVANDVWDASVHALAAARRAAPAATFGVLAERAMRVAAIDSGAIEGLYSVDRGFTMTVASMASAWEAQIQSEKGPDVAALVAAQRAGYDFALDAATAGIDVSEAWIRRLHEVVCQPQDTYDVRTAAGPQRHRLPKGSYKRAANHVELADGFIHAYAPVDATASEMNRLVTALHSEEFGVSHPVLQSSYAHYALACIHPFADGNGRVARALASVFTLRAVSLPLVIFADQKDSYLTALNAADRAQFQSFVDFVLFRSVDFQQILAEELRAAEGPLLEEAAARLRHVASYPEIPCLLERIRNEVQSQLGAQDFPESVTWSVGIGKWPDVDRTLPPPGRPVVRVQIATSTPKPAAIEEFLSVTGGPSATTDMPEFILTRGRRRRDWLRVRSDEVNPVISAALEFRIAAWLRRVVAELLTEVATQAEQT
jgi:fido (protein-threonine AMPylation protein)